MELKDRFMHLHVCAAYMDGKLAKISVRRMKMRLGERSVVLSQGSSKAYFKYTNNGNFDVGIERAQRAGS